VNAVLNRPQPYVAVYTLSGRNTSEDGGIWMTIGNIITGDEKGFGLSVSLISSHEAEEEGSRDVITLAVGSRYYARVYRLETARRDSSSDKGNEWVQLGNDIMENSVAYVALSGDGMSLAVGCPGYDETNHDDHGHSEYIYRTGRVRVFRVPSPHQGRRQQQWHDFVGELEMVGQSLKGIDQYDNFGHVVSLSYDGTTLAVGSYGGNYVQVFDYNAGDEVWGKSDSFWGDEDLDDSRFGASISLSHQGDRLAIGSSWYDDDSGRVVLYERSAVDGVKEAWKVIGGDIRGVLGDREVSFKTQRSFPEKTFSHVL